MKRNEEMIVAVKRNLRNCVKKPEKIQDFNGVWSSYMIYFIYH